jgi:hypothetical protein
MNPAKEKIEEAMDWLNEHDCNDTTDMNVSRSLVYLRQALALIPDWTVFDPKREETWPKDGLGAYDVIVQEASGLIGNQWEWEGYADAWEGVILYRDPLPEPFKKEEK